MKWSWSTLNLKLRHTFTIAHRSSDWRTNVLIQLDHQGITSWGEAAPNPRYGEDEASTREALGPLTAVIHADSIEGRWWEPLSSALVGSFAAKAAVDIALYDHWGKVQQQPLWRLLDAPYDGHSGLPLCMTIGIDDVATVIKKVKQAESFPCLKVKLGGSNDREMIEAIRSVSQLPIRIDANEGWSSRERAIREIEWLAPRNVEFIEQPMPATLVDDCEWLKERSPLPLIADEALKTESDLSHIAACYHGVNVKLMKCGGISPARQLIQSARDLNLKVMLGCMVESSVGIAAAAHLAPFADYLDLDGNLLIENDPFQGQNVRRGHLYLSQSNGLGVSPHRQVNHASDE